MGHVPLSPHFVFILLVFFLHVRRVSYISGLKSSSLMKKRSCSALQFSVPSSLELGTSEVSLMCVMCLAVVAEPLFPSVPSPEVAFFACCWQSLVLIWLVDQSGAALG